MWVFGGCIQLLECNLPAELLHELLQLVICKIPQVYLEVLDAGWFPIYLCHISPHMGGRRWEVLTLIDSLCNIIAFTTPHAAICNSSMVWNSMTDSITEYQSTPSGCMCPNWMQISMTSSSRMEEAPIRVPSLLVNMKRHIWLERLDTQLGIKSLAAKAVIVEVVDIMVG